MRKQSRWGAAEVRHGKPLEGYSAGWWVYPADESPVVGPFDSNAAASRWALSWGFGPVAIIGGRNNRDGG